MRFVVLVKLVIFQNIIQITGLFKSYLGVGPSAHSFDGKRRSWNISNNINYINSIKNDKLPSIKKY